MNLPWAGDAGLDGLLQHHGMVVCGIRHLHQQRSIKQCCGTVTIFYGTGSGSDFRQVTVPVQAPSEKILPFYIVSFFTGKNL
jgi:hypothetical protein